MEDVLIESINEDIVEVKISEADISESVVLKNPNINKRVKIIQPGWGSSGYYSEKTLKNAVDAGEFSWKHMHMDHPTEGDRNKRPERSLQTLAGIIEGGSAIYDENGEDGPGVYAKAIIFDTHKKTIESVAPYIGVSILGTGKAKMGKVTEAGKTRSGLIFEKIHVEYADFVTKPGAGGKIMEALKMEDTNKENEYVAEANSSTSAESGETDGNEATAESVVLSSTDSDSSSDSDWKAALEAKVEELTTLVGKYENERIIEHEVRKARVSNSVHPNVAERAKSKVSAKVSDGSVKIEDIPTLITEAIKEEMDYINSVTRPAVIGRDSEWIAKESAVVEDAFKRLGVEESIAKVAASRQ